MIRNPLSYPGNKNKLLKEIIPELPFTNNLVDVFCGSGVVGVNSISPSIHLNDISLWPTKILDTLYNIEFIKLVEEIEKRISLYNLTYSRIHEKKYYVEYKHEGLSLYNKLGYSKLKNHFNITKDIYDLIVLEIYGFNHYIRFNKKDEFNVPVGKVDFSDSIYNDLEKFMKLLKTKKIVFSNLDFRNRELYLDKEAIYYFDPPYLITTAPYNSGWSESDEMDLLKILDDLNSKGIKFALSNVFLSNGKKNDMLIEWSKKYKVIVLKRQYRNANYQKINITDSIEVLIKNY